jgi:hypothetical protein
MVMILMAILHLKLGCEDFQAKKIKINRWFWCEIQQRVHSVGASAI